MLLFTVLISLQQLRLLLQHYVAAATPTHFLNYCCSTSASLLLLLLLLLLLWRLTDGFARLGQRNMLKDFCCGVAASRGNESAAAAKKANSN